ncbi:MAG: hypothetical protein MZV70_46760 [Desulfobacterales bacterium]|nr:hypothetical protein [Desulfobacterales bacterium]
MEVFIRAPLAPLAPAAVPFASLKTALAERFRAYRGHVCVMATGIVVRLLAGLLVHKAEDPAVVVVDEGGGFAISLVSGHLGGANALARQVAAVLGARPVITTATDVNGVPAVDVVALELGLAVENPEAIKAVNMALLAGEPIAGARPGGLLTGRAPGAVPDGTVAARARVWVEDLHARPARGRARAAAPLARRRHRVQPQHRDRGDARAAARDPGGRRPGRGRASPAWPRSTSRPTSRGWPAWPKSSSWPWTISVARTSGGWRTTCRRPPPACTTTSE